MWRSSVLVSLLSLVCAFVSFANQLAIAYQFGASESIDAYLIATSVPLLFSGIAGGVFSYSTVPLLVSRRISDPEGYPEFSGAILMAFALLAFALALFTALVSDRIVAVLAPNLILAYRDEAILTMRISLLNFAFSTVTAYLVAVQNAEKRFLIPLFAGVLPYLGMLASVMLFAKTMSIMSLAWGMLVGYLAAIPVLYIGVAGVIRPGFRALRTYTREIKAIFFQMPLVLLSTLCFTVYGPIDSYWASRLGPANVSYLGYSQRLLIALGNLVVLGPVTVLTPYLAEQAARYQKKEFTKTLWTAIRITILLSAPLALILSMLRVPVIEILFQRGTFDATATQGVSSVLPGMLFGMVAMLIVILLLKALHSLGDIAGAAIIGATGSTSYFILSGLFSKYMGLDGIVLAYALTWWFLIGVSLWRFINLDIRFILPADIMKFIVQVVIPLILTGLCVHIGQKTCIRPIVEIGLINLTFRIGALSGSTFIIFMLLAWLLRMPEIRSLLEKICEQSYS